MTQSYYLDQSFGAWDARSAAGRADGDPTRMQPTGFDPPPTDGDIIVTGRMCQSPFLFQFVVWGWAADAYQAGFARRPGYNFVDYNDVLLDPPASDEDVRKVEVVFHRALLPEEKAAYDKFVSEVVAADKIIGSLPNDALIRMSDGAIIVGAQLETVWAKTD